MGPFQALACARQHRMPDSGADRPKGRCHSPITTGDRLASWAVHDALHTVSSWRFAGPACSPTPSRPAPSTRVTGRGPRVLLAVGAVALAGSGVAPRYRFTWLPEIAPIQIAGPS